MGSVGIATNIIYNNAHNEKKRLDSFSKLHDLVHKLEEDNEIPSPTKDNDNIFANHVNGVIDKKPLDDSSLEGAKELSLFDIDTDLESEDSWLYESPVKYTPSKAKNTESWLKQNVSTPELLRVRGSLSASLEVIAFENRKGRLMKINSKDNETNYRRTSKGGMLGTSSLSLDWDYDEDDDDFAASFQEDDGYHQAQRFDSDDDILDSQPSSRIAACQPRKSKTPAADPADRPFALDWTDDEEDDEDLKPMKIDFNDAPYSTGTYRKSKPTIARMPSSGGVGVAAPRSREPSQDEFTVKPRGMVKPRGAPSADASNSPQPRRTNIVKPVQRRKVDSPDSEPIPRGAVQRRKVDSPENEATPRLRGSGSTNSLVRPRGSANNMKSNSTNDLSDNLKVKLPNGDGSGLIRRRGATPQGEGIPQPRRSRDPSPAVARVQGIPQVRRSTGSIPKKSEGLPRPRQSLPGNPNAPRPRGGGLTQSYQNDY